MKRPLLIAVLWFSFYLYAQNNLSGGYYSVWQYYVADSVTHFSPPEGQWRSMQYFSLIYRTGNFEFGGQLESYLPQALLGYNPELEKTKLTGYYARYRENQWDVTAGHIYEQFGSGMALRTWENRQLGLNNSLFGIRTIYRLPGVQWTVLGGNPRTAMQISQSAIFGSDLQLDLARFIKKIPVWRVGLSFVSRFTERPSSATPPNVQIFSARTSLNIKAFDLSLEYVYKTPDALYSNGVIDDLVLFDGDAYILNMGYADKGIGTNLTVRRIENIQLHAEHQYQDNPYNTGILNYVPALTKQHDYLLTNLFVYAAQPAISFAEQTVGEIGGQWDMYFFLKRKSFLGGKYGTRIAFNWSRWHGLKAEFIPALHTYRVNFIEPGELYYQDINLEIKRKISKKIKTGLMIMKQDYNRRKIEGHGETLHNYILVTDWQYKLPKRSSVRMALEHLWNLEDEKNWAAGTLEYDYKGKIGFFITDRFHYGNTGIHYYSAGITYNDKGNRFSVSYGRERGGLVCVGGVCRYVPPNTGLQVTVSMNF